MLGAVTETSAKVWFRTSVSAEVQVVACPAPTFDENVSVAIGRTREGDDFTSIVTVSGLEPGTQYWYRLEIDGESDPNWAGRASPLFFTTAPAGPAKFRACIGSCAKYARDATQPIWFEVRNQRPDLFFWLGDNIYANASEQRLFAEEYRRQRDVEAFRPLGACVPQLAIWDDHDYGENDSDKYSPSREKSLEAFRQYWANSAYGLIDTPGVFFPYSYGGVDFFFLDNRTYRDTNSTLDGSAKTMLGKSQIAWLKRQLLRSRAPFKLLVAGGGWNVGRGPGGDSWSAFLTERDSLFDFIRDEEVDGVVLLSGDTHVAELNAIPWSERGGYDFYELVSSPLAQDPGSSWLECRPEARMRQVYFGGPNAGVIDFDLTEGDPVLRYNVVNARGRYVWPWFEIRASDLHNGRRSWRDKMDDESRQRQENYEKGKPYYSAAQ